MHLQPGQCIDGRYELLQPIGQGAQGSVFQVRDKVDGRSDRALKLVPLDQLDSHAFERARREARTLAKNPHPVLIPCHGFFEDIEVGVAGIVMDLVVGKALSSLLRDPRMTDAHRIALLEQLADGLAHVHRAEIIHRDLKPDNVLVTEAFWGAPGTPGGIKLLDFGIAAELWNDRPLTMTGGIIGTLPYLSPEHFVPNPSLGASQRSEGYSRDVYAFGVLGAELLLGRHPTGLPAHARPDEFAQFYMDAAGKRRPWPPSELVGRAGEIIAACLALDPLKRPASGVDIAERFKAPRTELTPFPPLGTNAPTSSGGTLILVAGPAPQRPAPTEPEHNGRYSDAPSRIPKPPSSSGRSGRPEIPGTSSKGILAGIAVGAVIATLLTWAVISRDSQAEEEDRNVNAAFSLPSAVVVASDPASPSTIPTMRESEGPVASASDNSAKPHIAAISEPAVPAAAESCPEPCCGGIHCKSTQNQSKLTKCASGLECNPGRCDDSIDSSGDKRWRLRLANVKKDMGKGQMASVNADVFAHISGRSGRRVRLSMQSQHASMGGIGYFPLTTRDLTDTGLDIWIRGDGRQLASRPKALINRPIYRTVLCQGLRIRDIKSARDESFEVIVFLDPE